MFFGRFYLAAAAVALSHIGNVDAFWRMNCGAVQVGRVDPIVNPGAVSAHAHLVVGGSNFGVNSTYSSLLNSQCSSCEVQSDKSAYWSPLLYYQHPNGSFEEVPHGGSVVYYLSRGPNQDNLTPFPKGFQMISGDKTLRSYNDTNLTWGNSTYPPRPIQDAVQYACLSEVLGPGTPGLMNTSYVNTCVNGLRAQIHFQSCWDGKNLYKSDNSHVAYLSDMDNGVCPPDHPYQFAHIFMEVNYAVSQVSNNTDGGQYVFSMGDATGYGFHADFQNGWDSSVLNQALKNCASTDSVDSSGVIQDCPILNQSDDVQYSFNCPERPAEISEPVHGMIAKLPGCITVTYGPEPATAADMECGAGIKQPTIVKTVDSVPLPSSTAAVGAYFGNKYNKYLGCGNDTYGSFMRTLNALTTTDTASMTVELCQSYCTKRGYRYSGLEAGTQCWCDVAVNPTALLNYSNVAYQCDHKCPGNFTEYCGGGQFMSVYNNTDPSFVPTTDLSNSVYQMTVTPAPYAKNYLGCASEGTNGRALNGTTYSSTNMTIESCAKFATVTNNYALYGLEYANQCWAGNALASGSQIIDNLTAPVIGVDCDMRCTGNFSEVCGGFGTLSVYNNTGYKAPAVQASVGKYLSKKCLTEGTSGRALQGTMTSNPSMTVDMCVKYCLGKSMHYAGLEYGTQCFCGNSVATSAGAKAIDCPMQDLMLCPGNYYQYCGGSNLLNLYYSSTL